MHKPDFASKAHLLTIAALLGMIAFRPYLQPMEIKAGSARFDHVYIASAGFLHNGEQRLLLLDKRNGNVGFTPRTNKGFKDPVFAVRVPFEKPDETPR